MADHDAKETVRTVREPARDIPVLTEAEVVVVGSGPSGMVAALAAARTGADTLLVERYGQIGGYFSNRPGGGFGLAFHDADGNQIIKGIPWELTDRVLACGGGIPPVETTTRSRIGWPPRTKYAKSRPFLDFETVKSVAFQMLEESRVDLLLHAYAVAALMEGQRITGVIIESKSGRQAVLGRMVVDATGDADIVAWAGAPFEKAPKGVLYQVQRCYHLGNVDTDRVREEIRRHLGDFTEVVYPADPMTIPPGYECPMSASVVPEGSWKILSADGMRFFISKSNVAEGRGSLRKGMAIGARKGVGTMIAATEADATDVRDLTAAEIRIRKQIVEGLEWLRKNTPGYEHSYLLGMGESEQLGVRETRRIVGEYTLTEDDIAEGRKFEDSVGRSANSIDMHLPKGDVEIRGVKGYHDIPYRCLVPKRVDNLLAAGRCISATHVAEAATRKVPVCMVTGQAAGVAAALASRKGVPPRNLEPGEIQRQLGALGN